MEKKLSACHDKLSLFCGKVSAFDEKATSKIPPCPVLASKLFAEFIGTGLLAFTIAVAAGQDAALAGVGIGATLMTAIYAGGHLSGAHYNPAVTLAILIRGKIKAVEAGAYVVAQICGALTGGLIGMVALKGDIPIGAPEIATGVGIGSAFVAELVLTFALCHTVLNVATTTAQANNSYYGLAIGFTVLSGAISVGGISGGCFNPAIKMLSFLRAIRSGSIGGGAWVHFVAPLVGGALSGTVFVILQPDEVDEDHNLVSKLGPASPFATTRKTIAPYVYEFLGTFFLCYTVATAASSTNKSGLAPLSIGAMLMGQVYAGGSTSGANYNPAVTVALAVRKAEYFVRAFGYVGAQVAGAFLALLLGRATVYPIGFPNPGEGYSIGHAFWAESVATFFLCYVVLQVATNSLVAGNNFFGLAIGFTVAAMAVTVGPVSGGCFNPAVDLLGLARGGKHYIYWSAPFVGAILAGVSFRLISPAEVTHTPDKRRKSTKVATKRSSVIHATMDPQRQSLMLYNPTVSEEKGKLRVNSMDVVAVTVDERSLSAMRPPSPKPKPPEKPKGAKPPEKPKPVTKTASVGDVVIQENKDDVEMPEGWVAMTDEGSGYQYFYNTKDGQTVWTWEEMEGGGTGNGAQYAEELKRAKALVKELVKEKSCAPILVRLAWHDSGTYDNRETKSWPEMGGAIGSIRTTHEITAGPNAGLKTALDGLLAPIKKVCPSLSWADLIQLASATAIEVSGGPVIPMIYGRIDGVPSKPTPPPFGLPDAKPANPAEHLRDVFYKYGMDDRDIVALSGAHTLGRAFKDRSGAVDDGYDGGSAYTKAGCPFLKNSKTTGGRPWTRTWLQFDNSYFTDMPLRDKECIAFPTDQVLMTDAKYKPHFEEFAMSQSAFFTQYALSHKKLSELGSKFGETFIV